MAYRLGPADAPHIELFVEQLCAQYLGDLV